MIINLTQHPATPEQLKAGVVDLTKENKLILISLLTVEKLPSSKEIKVRCEGIARLCVSNGISGVYSNDQHPEAAMIGGAPWMMATLEKELSNYGVPAVYAFSIRESVEEIQPDGTIKKVSIFKHAGFVKAN